VKKIFVMMFLSLASFVATAQTAHQKPSADEPALSAKQLKPGNRAELSADGMSTAGITPAWSYGWNYIHPQYCEEYYSGGYHYLYVYPKEGGSFSTTDTSYQALIYPACQTGNYLGFYVYDSYNDWSRVRAYSYK
jgi:hypothetical protein